MGYPVIGTCPVCGEDMLVTRLHCRHCDSTLEGRFQLSPFAKLTEEQLKFAILFIRCEGKLTRVGEEMHLSYPSVRSRLNDVIRALGYEISEGEAGATTAEQRQTILNELSQGLITAEQAVARLKKA